MTDLGAWRTDIENAPRNKRILIATDLDFYAVNLVKNPFTDHEAWLVVTYDGEGNQVIIGTELVRYWQPIIPPKQEARV